MTDETSLKRGTGTVPTGEGDDKEPSNLLKGAIQRAEF